MHKQTERLYFSHIVNLLNSQDIQL